MGWHSSEGFSVDEKQSVVAQKGAFSSEVCSVAK
jgi:hypothetical protein